MTPTTTTSEPRARPPLSDRFASGWAPSSTGCRIWQRARNNRGYGVIWAEGSLRLAHRVAWLLAYGRWPAPGLVLDHMCDTKACVNVEHLREVTNRLNVLRARQSPMNVMAASPTCRNGHPYPAQVERDRNGWRICPTCPSRRGGWAS